MTQSRWRGLRSPRTRTGCGLGEQSLEEVQFSNMTGTGQRGRVRSASRTGYAGYALTLLVFQRAQLGWEGGTVWGGSGNDVKICMVIDILGFHISLD